MLNYKKCKELIENARREEHTVKDGLEITNIVKDFLKLLENELVLGKEVYNSSYRRSISFKDRGENKEIRLIEIKSKDLPKFKDNMKKEIRNIKSVRAWILKHYNYLFSQLDKEEDF